MSKSNKAKLLTVYISCMVLIASFIGYSYSIFSANVTYTNKTNTVLKTDTLTMTFRGLNEVSCSNIIPGDKCIKTFEVQNTSNIATYYNIYMEDVTNGFDSYLVYTLKDGNTEVIPETATPPTTQGKAYIFTNITIPANTTKSYTLTIEYKYSPTVDQSNTQGHEFRTKVGIDTVQGAILPVMVTLNSNGGNVSLSQVLETPGQVYSNLPTPTKTGYTFKGWNGKNLFDKDAITSGYEILNSEISPNEDWFVTDYIEVEEGKTYVVSNSGRGILTYDSNKSLIARVSLDVNDAITIDSGVKYIKLNGRLTNLNTFQLEEGSTPSTYEPYLVTSSTIVTQNTNHTLKAIWEAN